MEARPFQTKKYLYVILKILVATLNKVKKKEFVYGSKVQCFKEPYSTGTWDVRSMDQDKLEGVKQVMARVNIDIVGISELKSTGPRGHRSAGVVDHPLHDRKP